MNTCPTCNRLLPEEVVYNCERCGAELPELVARVLYPTGGYQDFYLCSWPCVVAWLREVPNDCSAVLPVVKSKAAFFRAMESRVDNRGKVE